MSLEQIARDMKLGTFPNKSELTALEEQVEQLQAALNPFVNADWYAMGNGKFEAKISKEALDFAKSVLPPKS